MADEVEKNERVDRLIWKNVGVKPIRQIAEELGLPVEKVMQRRRELSEEVDVLTLDEEMHKVLSDWKDVAGIVREKINNVSDERNFSGIINSFNSLNKNIATEIGKLQSRNSGAIEALNQLRVRELLRLIDLTVAKTLKQIADENDLDETNLLAIFQSHLRPAVEEIEL